MTIVDILTQIEKINRDDVEAAAEFGPLEMGPRGAAVSDLLCVDGKTHVAASPQIREFYEYSLWWRLCSVELEWCNPFKLEELMIKPAIRDMVEGDFDRKNISVDGMIVSNSVLFSLDNRDSPFDRAYFVFGSAPEPRIVYAGSEVTVFENIQEYLESWLRTLS